MRLFVAIDLPDQVKQAIASIQGDLTGARWTPLEQLHLTLRFIGEVEGSIGQSITEALGRVNGSPFDLALEGIGHFSSGRFPRILWVSVAESAPLLELHFRVEQALVNAGIQPEGRPFSSHITIARLRDTSACQVHALEERHSAFSLAPFHVNVFHLFSSVLTPRGAVHTRQATYPLLGAR